MAPPTPPLEVAFHAARALSVKGVYPSGVEDRRDALPLTLGTGGLLDAGRGEVGF